MKPHPGLHRLCVTRLCAGFWWVEGCGCVCARAHVHVRMHAYVRVESVSRSVWKYCSKLGGDHVGKSEGLSGRDAYGW